MLATGAACVAPVATIAAVATAAAASTPLATSASSTALPATFPALDRATASQPQSAST